MLSLSTDNETYVADAVDRSVSEAFELMAGGPARLVSRHRFAESIGPPHGGSGLTAILSLTGELRGSICLCLPAPAALCWTRKVIDHDTDALDQVVVDAIGELGNIVVGGSKRRLSRFDLKMGLPSVVRAGKESLAFPTRTASLQLDYEFESCPFSVVIALGESAAERGW